MVQANPSAKEVVQLIGQQMGKDFSKIIQTLDEQLIETVDELLEMTPEQCAANNIPIGLINKIKKEVTKHASNPTAAIQKAQTLARTHTLTKAAKKGKLFVPHERKFVLIGNHDYSHRRTESGYEGFTDLDAVNTDIINTK